MPIGQILAMPEEREEPNMCRNVYSIQSKEAVVALFKSGYTIKQIADLTNVGYSSAQHYVEKFKTENPEFKTSKQLQRIEQEKKLCDLYKSGITKRKELERQSGIPCGSIEYVLGKWGVSLAAKEARKQSGEIPEELMKPVLNWLANHAAKDVANKMAEFAKSLIA